MTPAERQALHKLRMKAVLDAAEAWALAYVAQSEGFAAAERRLDLAVTEWQAYRGKGQTS